MNTYRHELEVNAPKRRTKAFTIDIERTKQVELRLAKDYIKITAGLTRRREPQAILSERSRLFPSALKKAMLLHFLLYSKPISIKFYKFTVNEKTDVRKEPPGSPYIYSLITKKLVRALGTGWRRDEVLQGVASCKSDRLIAALNAYLMSKSKSNETERFMYLWMAMNGLYGHYAVTFKNCRGNNDTHMQTIFADLYGFENLPDSYFATNHRDRADKVIFRNHSESFLAALHRKKPELSEDFVRFLVLDAESVNMYGYYLIRHSYSYRCRIFHANYQLKLLSRADEAEIVVLRALSDVMEDFLDRNLPNWFDSAYVNREIVPRANGTDKTPLPVCWQLR